MSKLTEALKLAEDAFQSVQDEVSFELDETHIALFGAAATFFQYYLVPRIHEDKHLPVDELIVGEVQGQTICEPVTEAEFVNHAHMVGSRVAVKRPSGHYRGEYLGPIANNAHVKIDNIRVAVPFEDVLVY